MVDLLRWVLTFEIHLQQFWIYFYNINYYYPYALDFLLFGQFGQNEGFQFIDPESLHVIYAEMMTVN